MNVILLKQMSILAAIIGAALGVVTVIPYIGLISFLICMTCVSVIVMVYMKKLDLIGVLEPRESAAYGAVIGALSFAGFLVTFIPLAAIVGFFNRMSYYGSIFLLVKNGFFILLLILLMITIIPALFNSFSAMSATFLYNQFKQQKNR